MKKANLGLGLLFLSTLLPACRAGVTGRIYFDLDGGVFTDESFSTEMLVGDAGTPVEIKIPDPVKEGYYFVGWREKNSDGSYRQISKKLTSDGTLSYFYPYGNDTFYAYFEPLVTMNFDLGLGTACTIVAPKLGSENFSNNTLNGYASKVIPSVDYLPSVDTTGSHLNFEYWYTTYPLVEQEDVTKIKHYKLDKSAEVGQYRFDRLFTDSMQFLLDSSVTLYAFYESDPTITVHYNLPDIEDYQFQAKDNATAEIKAMMKEKLGIDYDQSASAYYYTHNEKTYRFAGFYLDSEFKSPFGIESPISSSNFDIYLKWDKQVVVSLDYNGGTYHGETSHTLTNTLYEGDLLPENLLDEYVPLKDDATFLWYELDGKKFSPLRDRLPNHDITLVASYEDNPVLTLKYDYPTSYTGDKLPDTVLKIKAGESIDTAMSEFKDALTETNLVCTYFYTLNSDNKEVDFILNFMPDEALTIFLKVDYLAKTTILSCANVNSDYELQTDIDAFEEFVDDDGVQLDDFATITDPVVINSRTYFYDGLYETSDLSSAMVLPFFVNSSHTEEQIVTLYRKLTKSIILTFVTSTLDPLGTLEVMPGGALDDFKDQIVALVGAYSSLEIDSRPLGNTLPKTDCTVVVK